MQNFNKSKWIWRSPEAKADEYVEFYVNFPYSDGKTELFISADSNYAVYVDGRLCVSMQYAD